MANLLTRTMFFVTGIGKVGTNVYRCANFPTDPPGLIVKLESVCVNVGTVGTAIWVKSICISPIINSETGLLMALDIASKTSGSLEISYFSCENRVTGNRKIMGKQDLIKILLVFFLFIFVVLQGLYHKYKVKIRGSQFYSPFVGNQGDLKFFIDKIVGVLHHI